MSRLTVITPFSVVLFLLLHGCSAKDNPSNVIIEANQDDVKNSVSFLCDTNSSPEELANKISTKLVDNSAFNEVFNKELSANGTNFIKERMEFTEKVPTLVNVDLLYSPDQVIISEEPYGKTYPPMPLKSPGLRLYALPSKLKITDSNGDSKKVFDFLPNESVSISLLGCPGASSYIYINGELAGNIAEPFETGVWSMGQGFLERNWAGNIKVSILTAPP